MKEKKVKLMSGEAYIAYRKKLKAKDKAKGKAKTNNNSFEALPYLKNGEKPATQAQINYIQGLLKNSNIKYDYNFQRDKYGLSVYVASLFIEAIKAGENFKISEHTVKTLKKRIPIKQEIEINEELFFCNE